LCKAINILAYYISAYYKALNTQELSRDQKKKKEVDNKMERIDKWFDRVNDSDVTVERLKVLDNEKIPIRKLNKLEREGIILDWHVRLEVDYRVLVIVWKGLVI